MSIFLTVSLTGNPEKLRKIQSLVEHDKYQLSFQHLKEKFQKYKHWGTPLHTPSEIYDVYFGSDCQLIYEIKVTSSVPAPFFHELSMMYPGIDINLDYVIPSQYIHGHYHFKFGHLLSHQSMCESNLEQHHEQLFRKKKD
ncbi:hypothetical protein ABID56_001021 [Alkalibacillus flavidus]|uniref:Uncharacterized protein n=1 Tax=Alkalibacillus flavidus TaxID=546021 RepID=A0ABV2KWI8_9BACI